MSTKEQIEGIIYEWVTDHYGECEAQDPSWNTAKLAKYISEKLNTPGYKPAYTPKYLPLENE